MRRSCRIDDARQSADGTGSENGENEGEAVDGGESTVSLLQIGGDTALANTILVFAINLVIGIGAIHLGAMLVVDVDTGYTRAAITALVGALAWALVVFFLPGVPVVGPLLGLVIWVTLINWQYPGGWVTAATIGVVAWLVAIGLLWVLATFDLVGFEALGVPGA